MKLTFIISLAIVTLVASQDRDLQLAIQTSTSTAQSSTATAQSSTTSTQAGTSFFNFWRWPTRPPINQPTVRAPSVPTPSPTPVPTQRPTPVPTRMPIPGPTKVPTTTPTSTPTRSPTKLPTARPTANPTPAPTSRPILALLPSSSPANAVDLTTPEGLIAAARIAITDVFLADRSLGYKMVRLGFHDCVGGCDGCVDLLNPNNNGLDVVITALESVVANFAKDNVTRTDIWCLSAIVYADFAQGAERTDFPFKWYGRPTCEMNNAICRNSAGQAVPCTPTRGPHRVLPSPDLDTHGVLEYFQNTFGFDTQETVALMGAHTLGKVERENSGFVGESWDENKGLLDNDYYKQLVGGQSADDPVSVLTENAPNWTRLAVDNSDLTNIPNRFQWELDSKLMLNADVSLVRNFTGQIESNGHVTCAFRAANACPAAVQTLGHAAVYRNNNQLWLEDFRDVLETMLNYPFITGTGCPGINLCYIASLPKAQRA